MNKLILALLIVALAAPVHADKASRANGRGLETYENGEYEESVRHFTDALVERPESPVLRFNRGTALAAQKNHKEAVNELLSAAKSMETPDGSAAAMYNAANSLAVANSLEDAVTLYKQGVKLDQQSEDIRHNLEQVMRKMRDKDQQEQEQEQEQQQQDQQKKDQDSQNKDKNDQQDEKDKKEQDKKQQDQNNKTDQQNKDQQQDQQQQESQQDQSEKQPMSPEEAKRLLDALNDEEKKSLSMRYQKMMREMRQGDDW